jgi:hypothetical protein
MRTRILEIGLVTLLCVSLSGCAEDPVKPSREVVMEGIIHHVHYDIGDGKTGGLTRLNTPDAVPGKNGSWNVNAYGKLYNDYFLITHLDNEYLGTRVIPAHRLLSIQFGDGGIKQVAERPSMD